MKNIEKTKSNCLFQWVLEQAAGIDSEVAATTIARQQMISLVTEKGSAPFVLQPRQPHLD